MAARLRSPLFRSRGEADACGLLARHVEAEVVAGVRVVEQDQDGLRLGDAQEGDITVGGFVQRPVFARHQRGELAVAPRSAAGRS